MMRAGTRQTQIKGDIQRMSSENLRPLLGVFDDFEAQFFTEFARIVRNHLEIFDFTRNVVKSFALEFVLHFCRHSHSEGSADAIFDQYRY